MSDLYEKLREDLLRFARSISRDPQEANDLLQDAWMKSLKETWLLEVEDYKQRAWFFRVMKNKLRDERRKEKRLVEWTMDEDYSVESITDDPLEVSELLAHLPKEWSDLIFKKYWVGLSSGEIGKQMDIPAATVRYKLHLAMKRLRKIIEEEK